MAFITNQPYKSAGKKIGARGFEPPTPRSRTVCATRLRYAPNKAEVVKLRNCEDEQKIGFFHLHNFATSWTSIR
jgi:hypothetical protein